MSLEDTPPNQARLPQPEGRRPGCGFPVARSAAVFSLTTGFLLSQINGSLYVPERVRLARASHVPLAG